MTASLSIRPVPALLAYAIVLLCTSAEAADDARLTEIETRYQSERAACESAQDKAACLRDAAAARDAARHGQLEGAKGDYDQNALARCAALPVVERDACASPGARRRRDAGQRRRGRHHARIPRVHAAFRAGRGSGALICRHNRSTIDLLPAERDREAASFFSVSIRRAEGAGP